jgi:hypothetical protein
MFGEIVALEWRECEACIWEDRPLGGIEAVHFEVISSDSDIRRVGRRERDIAK